MVDEESKFHNVIFSKSNTIVTWSDTKGLKWVIWTNFEVKVFSFCNGWRDKLLANRRRSEIYRGISTINISRRISHRRYNTKWRRNQGFLLGGRGLHLAPWTQKNKPKDNTKTFLKENKKLITNEIHDSKAFQFLIINITYILGDS